MSLPRRHGDLYILQRTKTLAKAKLKEDNELSSHNDSQFIGANSSRSLHDKRPVSSYRAVISCQ